MKNNKHISLLLTLLCSALLFAQQPERNDDLGDVSDAFQTNFFEAIKQKEIENYDKAIDALVNCKIQEPQNAAVYFELGKNYFELDKYQLAEDAFVKANQLKPNNKWILYALYKLHRATKNNTKITEDLIALSKHHLKYKEILSQHYYNTQQYKKALQIIEQLDVDTGINAKRENLRYTIYIRQKEHKALIDYVQKKIQNKTVTTTDYTRLIYTYSILKDNQKGYETAEAFKAAFPNTARPYLSLYKYYQNQGKIEDAIAAMDIILKNTNDISDSEKNNVLNDFFLFTKSNISYLPELEKALKIHPNKRIANRMINLYDRTNNTEKSKEILADAITQTSTNFEDLKNLTTLLLQKNKFNDALKISNNALDLYPAQPTLYLQKGKALLGLKRAKKALSILEMGLDYCIDNITLENTFYQTMASAALALGDTKNQKKYLAKIKK